MESVTIRPTRLSKGQPALNETQPDPTKSQFTGRPQPISQLKNTVEPGLKWIFRQQNHTDLNSRTSTISLLRSPVNGKQLKFCFIVCKCISGFIFGFPVFQYVAYGRCRTGGGMPR